LPYPAFRAPAAQGNYDHARFANAPRWFTHARPCRIYSLASGLRTYHREKKLYLVAAADETLCWTQRLGNSADVGVMAGADYCRFQNVFNPGAWREHHHPSVQPFR